jgi:hypothetical protein
MVDWLLMIRKTWFIAVKIGDHFVVTTWFVDIYWRSL